jgi:hypothetical protein
MQNDEQALHHAIENQEQSGPSFSSPTRHLVAIPMPTVPKDGGSDRELDQGTDEGDDHCGEEERIETEDESDEGPPPPVERKGGRKPVRYTTSL